MGTGRRRGTLVVLVVALTACGGGGHHSAAPALTTPSTSPPTSAPTTSTTLDPTKAAILASYRAGWADFLAVVSTFPVRPLDSRLSLHSVGKELLHDQQLLTTLSAKGHYAKGPIDLSPVVVSVSNDTATVMDCVFDHSVEVDGKTGVAVTKPDVGHSLDKFTLTRVSGSWLVSDSTIVKPGTTEDACSSAA